MSYKEDRGMRLLDMFYCFLQGDALTKNQLIEKYGDISRRTVQRDLDDLRAFLAEHRDYFGEAEIQYQRHQGAGKNGYQLVKKDDQHLSPLETLSIAWILSESRALGMAELQLMLNKILVILSPELKPAVYRMVSDLMEKRRHSEMDPDRLPLVEIIMTGIRSKRVLSFQYRELGEEGRAVEVRPVIAGVCRDQFFLLGYECHTDGVWPKEYWLDRMAGLTLMEIHYKLDSIEMARARDYEKNLRGQRMY